jgi:hypothetical protein
MSKVAVKGNASGTGTFTIESPNSNTNRTFNLPDASGTVLTDVSDITAQVKTATNASGSAPVYACRAWVNFDGTTSPGTIRASGNVSSVTRNSTGFYTVSFSTAMPDANYACATGAITAQDRIDVITSSSVQVSSESSAGSRVDSPAFTLAVFR